MIDPDDFRASRNSGPVRLPSPADDPDSAFFRNLSLGAVAIVFGLIVVAAVTAPYLPPSLASLPSTDLPPQSSNAPSDSTATTIPRQAR